MNLERIKFLALLLAEYLAAGNTFDAATTATVAAMIVQLLNEGEGRLMGNRDDDPDLDF